MDLRLIRCSSRVLKCRVSTIRFRTPAPPPPPPRCPLPPQKKNNELPLRGQIGISVFHVFVGGILKQMKCREKGHGRVDVTLDFQRLENTSGPDSKPYNQLQAEVTALRTIRIRGLGCLMVSHGVSLRGRAGTKSTHRLAEPHPHLRSTLALTFAGLGFPCFLFVLMHITLVDSGTGFLACHSGAF